MSVAKEKHEIRIERIDSLTEKGGGTVQESPAMLFDHALYYIGTLISSALILAFYSV